MAIKFEELVYMKNSPYLIDDRLADVLAAIQFLANYKDYDLTAEKFRDKIARTPASGGDWKDVLLQHPEFFRQSEHADDFCLVLRRTRPKDSKNKRPPLEASELSLLVETATFLQRQALEQQAIERRDMLEQQTIRRGWVQMAVSLFAAIVTASAAIAAAIIRTGCP